MLETDGDQASIVADRVREAVAQCQFMRAPDGQQGWTVTQSLTPFDTDSQTSHGCLKVAERALADARAIAAARIEVTSELNRGSTFRVSLPGLAQLNA